MHILGIESSCDETAVALYNVKTQTLLAHCLYSQANLHALYGGVVPELASRDHIDKITVLTQDCLHQANRDYDDIDAIAYTQGPGLGGCLLVGASFAHGLSFSLNKPLIAVHHLEGHLLSPLLTTPRPEFPFMALLVSGGHTQFFKVQSVGQYELLGESVDDAAGEAFDKVAKLLGLAYPGGAALSNLADSGNSKAFDFPRPLLHQNGLDMSFSGLKTAVFVKVRELNHAGQKELSLQQKQDIAASFQAAVVEVLSKKAQRSLSLSGLSRLVVAGGVGANLALRRSLLRLSAQVYFPPISFCTDNAAMIALAGALHYTQARKEVEVVVKPRWALSDTYSNEYRSGR